MKILALSFILVLSGCGFFKKQTVICDTKEVVKKIPVKYEPKKFEPYILPTSFLTEKSTPQEIGEAYVAAIKILKYEVTARDNVLEEYRNFNPEESKSNE